MKKAILLTTILISINLLSGCDLPRCDVCTDNCYTFEDITNYSIDQITSLGCSLLPKDSALYSSNDPQFIYDRLTTNYVHTDHIIDTSDFDIGIYLGVGDVFLAPFFIINSKIITKIDEGRECYESICTITQRDINHIVWSIKSS